MPLSRIGGGSVIVQGTCLRDTAVQTASILVVDDDPANARMLAHILRHSGFEVQATDSAQAALDAAAKRHFDLIISDISMPEMDGWQLMRILQGQHPIRGIAFSAFDSPEDRARSQAAGYRTHLSKPIDIDKLINVVHRVLDDLPHGDDHE